MSLYPKKRKERPTDTDSLNHGRSAGGPSLSLASSSSLDIPTTSTSSQPPTPASSLHATQPITPKYLRTSHALLVRRLASLDGEVKLLCRAWYKSRAQHRRSKWLGAVEGVKRASRAVSESAREAREMGRRAANGGGATGAAYKGKTREGSELGTDVVALSCITDVWCALWEERGRGRTFLPKYDRPPLTSALPPRILLEACLSLASLAMHLEALRLSARRAIKVLASHLRTPPAPTFAPLVVSLLSICASIEGCASAIAWGEDDGVSERSEGDGPESQAKIKLAKANEGVAELYQFLRSAARPSVDRLGDQMEQDGPKRTSRRQRARAAASHRLVLGLTRPGQETQEALRKLGKAWQDRFGAASTSKSKRDIEGGHDAREEADETGQGLEWLPEKIVSSLGRTGEGEQEVESGEENPVQPHRTALVEEGQTMGQRVGSGPSEIVKALEGSKAVGSNPSSGLAGSGLGDDEDLGEAIAL